MKFERNIRYREYYLGRTNIHAVCKRLPGICLLQVASRLISYYICMLLKEVI